MKRLLFLCFIIGLAGTAFAQTKTVSNSELEKYRQKRVESERQLREDYKKLGFPSPEELEEQNERRRVEMDELADQLKTEQAQKQSDILAQADVLRSQIASVEAQINYLRSQIGSYSSDQTVVLAYGIGSSFPYRGGRPGRRQPRFLSSPVIGPVIGPNTQATQDIARMYPNSQDVYNRSIGNYAYQNQRPFGRVGFGRRGKGFFRGGFLAPVIIGSADYAPNYLEAQLIALEQQRAGLLAQWRLLEEHARRAGVKID